jgi:hypothetical protein
MQYRVITTHHKSDAKNLYLDKIYPILSNLGSFQSGCGVFILFQFKFRAEITILISCAMAPPRRQSTTKVPQAPQTPSTAQTPLLRPPIPPQPPSKLKIHPLLETYEATISSLIGTLSDDPFRADSIHEVARRLLLCEKDLEEALEEGSTH